MKEIPLTKGKFAIVDDEDYPLLSRHKWQYNGASGGAVHSTFEKEKSPYQMQDWIIQKGPSKKIMFKNKNPLDLQKTNLVEVHGGTPTHYSFKRKGEYTSKYKGVCWAKKDKVWMMQIHSQGRAIRKCFKDEKEAALAYNKIARELYGELAYQNDV